MTTVNLVNHIFIPLSSSFVTLVYIYFSCNAPWIRVFVPFTSSYFTMSVPLDIGLTACFSDFCNQVSSADQPGGSLKNNSTINSTGSNEKHYFDSSNQYNTYKSVIGNIFKWSLGPYINIEPNEVERIQAPFQRAAFWTLIFFSIATICAVYSIIYAMYSVCILSEASAASLRISKENRQIVHLWVITVSLLAGGVSYLMLTCTHLGGGFYFIGDLLLLLVYLCILFYDVVILKLK